MTANYTVRSELREGIEVFTLADDASAAVVEIAPALGNNCFAFQCGGHAVLEPVSFAEFTKRPTSYGIPILFPFPNRIRDGKFTFHGEEYQIDPPRHGFVRDKPWIVETYSASDSEGAWITSIFDAAFYAERILSQFPFPFRLEVTYRLKDGSLEMRTTAYNKGDREMPVGFGIHPYFRKPTKGSITVPADRRWELVDSLPTGKTLPVEGKYDLRSGRNLDDLSLDDIFTGVVPNKGDDARCLLEDLEANIRTVVEFSHHHFPHVVVYTPPNPRQAICIEPNSCPTDAFNLQARGLESDVIVLSAGEAVSFDLRIYMKGMAT